MRRIDPQDILSTDDLTRKKAMISYFTQQIRIDVMTLLNRVGSGHWGGSSSAADITAALYFYRMLIDPENPRMETRDRFVMSKGHAAPMLYSVLANRGFFPVEEVQTLRTLNSRLQGHPCMNKTPGVDMSTGALGHGLSVGLGMSLAARLSGNNFWTYVMVGDGCLNEGQSWEAVMAAAKFQPARMVLLVDYNKVQLDGSSKDIMPLDPIYDKFQAFNWSIAPKIYDGHDMDEIFESFQWLDEQDRLSREGEEKNQAPYVIVYKTHKGKGVSFMEDNHAWHGAPVTDDIFREALPELQADLEKLEAAVWNK
jgi:transketolase